MQTRIRYVVVLAALCAPISKAQALNDPMFCSISYEVVSSSQTSLELQFSAKAAGAALPYSFHWDFGDGGSSDLRDPFHTFASPGFYDVVLTATGSGGPSPIGRDTVVVSPGYSIDPFCISAATPTWGVVPLEVQFQGDPAFSFPTSWHWDFGDGSTSDLRNPSHAYTQGGTYFVTLVGIENGSSSPCYTAGRQSLRVTALPMDAVGVDLPADPSGLRLQLAGTNPFTLEARLTFELPRSGRARVTIVDLAGRRVAALLDQAQPAGRHAVSWRGLTDDGSTAAAGMYLAVLEYEGTSRAIRIIRLR